MAIKRCLTSLRPSCKWVLRVMFRTCFRGIKGISEQVNELVTGYKQSPLQAYKLVNSFIRPLVNSPIRPQATALLPMSVFSST